MVAGCAAGSGAFVGGADPGPDGMPVLFAPGVVSTGDVFSSTFTPTGRTVVFTKVAATGRPFTLFQSRLRDDGGWSTPESLPFSGVYRDLDPAFSPDGARLYFTSRRPVGPTPADTTSLDDTWYVDRAATGWSAPVRIPPPVNSDSNDMYPSVARNGNLYFDSMRSGRRMVYRAPALPGGGWGAPALLDATINADSGASNLFVDPDERYVVFAAGRPGGAGGADLYVSWRTPTGWSAAQSVGPTVNTRESEYCPFVSHDGRYLFFTRAVSRGRGQPDRNIYVARFDVLLQRLGRGASPGL
jgi:Tol biopolymer transport system component